MKLPIPMGDHHPPAMVYTYHASQTRGILINQVILLERWMDNYISLYFCNSPEKAIELMDIILATKRITFDSKAQVFRYLLDKKHPKRKAENKKLSTDFQFIAEERNMLAHFFLDVSPQIVNKFNEQNVTFTLLKIDKVRTAEVFDFKRIKKLGDMVVFYTDLIIELVTHLPSLPDASDKDLQR